MKKLTTFSKSEAAFDAEGTTLRGWLYRPNTNEQVPAIVMAHGYNCLKEFYLDKYAEVFAATGFAVLVYDNRNFGDSDGLPRQELDPWQQVRDYRHAISYMQTLDFVNKERIGIWGTSYSGGHVLVVAAIDKRVKAVVSQVPTITGYRNMLRRIKPDAWDHLRQQFTEDRLKRFNGEIPAMVPMVTAPHEANQASHATEDAWRFFTGQDAPKEDQWRFKNWRNEVTLRSIEMYSEYEPGSYITRIAPTPLLMVVAKNDVISMTDEQISAFNTAGEIKSLQLFSGGHFDAYTNKFSFTSTAASRWFDYYL